MSPIQYVVGDVTHPVGSGRKILVHCCNNENAWGAGVVLAISRRWPEPEEDFRAWRSPSGGDVRFIQVDPDLVVANMIGQDGVGFRNGPPIRYDWLRQALTTVASRAITTGASVCGPRFGCGLAGGSWDLVEPIIQQELCDRGIAVAIYDLPGSR